MNYVNRKAETKTNRKRGSRLNKQMSWPCRSSPERLQSTEDPSASKNQPVEKRNVQRINRSAWRLEA